MPSVDRAVSARRKRSNACGRNSGGKPGPVVADVELDPPVRLAGPDADRAVAVAEGVLDEVSERLLDAHAVRFDGGVRFIVEAELASIAPGAVAQAVAHRREEVGDLDRLQLQRQPALVGAGDDQQGLGELREAVGLLDRRGDRGAQLLAAGAVAQRQLELRLVRRRAGCAARGWRRRRTRARAPARSRAGRASGSGSRRGGEARRAATGTGRRWLATGGRDLRGAPAHRLDRAQRRADRHSTRPATRAGARSGPRSEAVGAGSRALRRDRRARRRRRRSACWPSNSNGRGEEALGLGARRRGPGRSKVISPAPGLGDLAGREHRSAAWAAAG